jgi:hypothetical protein
MPVALPPVVAPLDAALPRAQSDRLIGGNPALEGAYRATSQALGVTWTGVAVQVDGPALPAGLHAMLTRHNPALAQAVGGAGTYTQTLPGTAVQRTRALTAADRAVLTVFQATGLLTALPDNAVVAPVAGVGGGDAFQFEGDVGAARLQMDPDITGSFQAILDDPRLAQVDPVALRWLTLAHEAAHAQSTLWGADPFEHPTWSASANAAMNRLVFHAGGSLGDAMEMRSPRPAGIFNEGFADTYGALMLLRVTHNAPQAIRVIEEMAAIRHAMSAARLSDLEAGLLAPGTSRVAAAEQAFDPHATEDAWALLLHDLHGGALAHLEAQSPEALRTQARHYASEGMVAFLHSPEGRMINDLGWAIGRSDDPADPAQDPNVVATAQMERIQAYLQQRLGEYSLAAARHRPVHAPASPGADPVFAHFAQEDAALALAFAHLPAAERARFTRANRQADADFDMAHTPRLAAFFQKSIGEGQDVFEASLTGPASRAALAADHATVEAALHPSLARKMAPEASIGTPSGLRRPAARPPSP